MTILAPFGGPWDHFDTFLVIKCGTDAIRGTVEGPKVDFGWFLMDFGSPFGHPFGSLFDMFCYLKRQKACLDCRHDYCRLLSWTYADFWCPHLSIYMVNTDVFIRFHFFDFFVNLRISGTNLEFILGTFEGLGRLLWWFLCVLDMHWNFVDFQRRPKLRHPSQERVKRFIRGGYSNQQTACWKL